MIRFCLRCAQQHEFEGWFKDGAAFEQQAAESSIVCPVCGDRRVEKAPMAPNLVGSRSGEDSPSPEAVREALKEVRRQIEANADYVGAAFPEEARRIHYGESEKKAIYGEASLKEATALNEEGIDVAVVPWLPREN